MKNGELSIKDDEYLWPETYSYNGINTAVHRDEQGRESLSLHVRHNKYSPHRYLPK